MVKHIQTIRRQFGDKLFGCVWPFCGIALKRLTSTGKLWVSFHKIRTVSIVFAKLSQFSVKLAKKLNKDLKVTLLHVGKQEF